MPEPTAEQLAAGESMGLTPAMCSYLRGGSVEELTADADALLAEFGPPAPPSPRSGGNRGTDVQSVGGNSVAAGANLYRERHGIPQDDDERPAPTDGRNPFATRTYDFNGR